VAETRLLTAVLTPDPDGGYVAQIAELPGAISQGETVEEALANVREAAELYLEDATTDEVAALGAHPVTAVVEVNVA
jgi:predicted RNase H-like HicB family nuclease